MHGVSFETSQQGGNGRARRLALRPIMDKMSALLTATLTAAVRLLAQEP
jgi:hypothetical protein